MRSLACVLVLSLAAVGLSQPVLDGTRDGSYNLRSVQTVQTQFGDANPNGGSELDAGWAQIHNGTLYLVLTGNLENNFNKLNIFFDTVAGGENVLTNNTGAGGNNPSNDGWAGKYAGFTFDSGFAADFMIIMRNGNFGGDRFDIDFNSVGSASVVHTAGNVFSGSLTGSNANALPGVGIGVAYDRSNAGGVTGGTGAANQAAAQAVTTGIELAIPLAALGSPLGDIRVSAHINGSNHDYLSNQSLGGFMPPQGNLGGDGNGGFNGTVGQLNLNNFSGNQWFVAATVPEPGTLTVLALAGLGLLRGRRRR